MRRSIDSRKLVAVIVTIALSALLTFLFGKELYLFARYRDEGERGVVRIVDSIRGTVVLPDETPALATVKDKSQINRGGVLRSTENGDNILLYYQSGVAVLYRPSVSKVVAIGPLVLDASAAQVKGTRIAVRDGSGDDSKTATVLALLKSRYSEASIQEPTKAGRSDFPKTVVIDLSENGSKTELSNAMIELLGAQKGVMPAGEPKPDADILVIVGKDFN